MLGTGGSTRYEPTVETTDTSTVAMSMLPRQTDAHSNDGDKIRGVTKRTLCKKKPARIF